MTVTHPAAYVTSMEDEPVIAVVPNDASDAGLADSLGRYLNSPAVQAELQREVERFWLMLAWLGEP